MQKNQGEIATVITIGTLIILGISSLASSLFLKQTQTTKTKAQTSCSCEGGTCSSGCTNSGVDCWQDPNVCYVSSQTPTLSCTSKTDPWYCAGECANQEVRTLFNGTYPPDGSDEWRNEKAHNCNIDPTKCSTTDSCSGATSTVGEPNPTKAPNPGGFHLTSEIYAEKSSDGANFNVHIKFNSDGCDGDVMLYRDGAHIAGPNGWNIKMGPFDYDENWAGRFTVKKGQSISPSYRGTVNRCPKSPVTLQDTIQCNLFVDSDGNPGVTGAGCTAKGFTNPAPKPTATPTPTPTPETAPKTDGSEKSSCHYEFGPHCKEGLVCDTSGAGGYGVCRKPTPTPAGAAAPTTPQLVGKCHDEVGQSKDCPATEDYVNPSNPSTPLVRYVQCGAKGSEDEACQFTCFEKDLTTGKPGSKRVECKAGDFGRIQIFGPKFKYNIAVINNINETVIVKSIVVDKYTVGNIQTASIPLRPNVEIQPGAFSEINIPGGECGLGGWDGDRVVSIVYIHKANLKEYSQLYLRFGCLDRPVIQIAQ